jgi:hypothetical protein
MSDDQMVISDEDDVVYVRTETAGMGGAGSAAGNGVGGVGGAGNEADGNDDVCSICLSPDMDVSLDCFHHFHAKCLAKYFFGMAHGSAVRCPYCRESVSAETEMDVWAQVSPSDIGYGPAGAAVGQD